MIKREYFFSGRLNVEGKTLFSGTHYRTSFFQDPKKVMDEITESISKKGDVEKQEIHFDTFHRI